VNRALRAATMGVLLLSPVALSACSAGQVNQTASQNRDQTGAQAEVGAVDVRAATLEYPRGEVYERGDDAELRLAIVNSGDEADTLTDVDGEGFGDAEIEAPSATGSGTTDEIEIGPRDSVLVDGEDYTITLTDLDEDLTVGQYIDVVLTFRNAGEVSFRVTIANPLNDLPRGEGFDFHEEHAEE
jgi:copper(I)-binding protein